MASDLGATASQGNIQVLARKITIYTTKGSLTGSGKATQNTTTNAVTNGTFTLTRGTGGYKGHKFSGKFSGTYKEGVYTFKYTGTYR